MGLFMGLHVYTFERSCQPLPVMIDGVSSSVPESARPARGYSQHFDEVSL